jgi:6-pyruvoyltetrahydropterin/6-carboxytetrahydropterin synthase
MYEVVKTFGDNEGLSCCFRQWRADSHCNLLHGYALNITMRFSSKTLDARNWVVDFGGFKMVKAFIHNNFDHTTLIAKDDPELETFKMLHKKKLIELRIVDHVGCEKFAEYIYTYCKRELLFCKFYLDSVEVSEHSSNKAIFRKD